MTPTQRPTFSWRVIGGGGGFSYLLASGGATGSINFDFTTGSLPAGITFTRASIGTYNSSGNILTTAGNDVARFNYVGGVANLLIEDTATNILRQSNAFTTLWTIYAGGSVAAAAFVSPDGTNNGWSLGSSGGGGGGVTHNETVSATPYVCSIWVNRLTGTGDFTFNIGAASSGTISLSATLARVSRTLTPATGLQQVIIQVVTPTAGFLDGIYGMQIETGSVMTSYIPTTTAAVTRQADSAVFTIPTGINQLVYTFDDNSTQTVAVSPGSYTIPTTLNRPNIKSIAGRYAFDFTGGSLPAGMTFTRPSIGTYTNVSGTLVTAGNDVARMNYVSGVSCLLVEGSATNLFLQSNAFTTTWSNFNSAVVTAAAFVSPDGTNNGWSVTPGAGGAALYQTSIIYTNSPYTMSVWEKRITGTSNINLQISAIDTIVNPTTVLARMSVTTTAPGGSGNGLIGMGSVLSDVNGRYGAQLEAGSKMTSYIPTTTASVTRAADSATFTIPSGVGHLTFTFDDNTTQLVTVSAGSYTIPVTLNRSNIKSIVGSA